MSSAPTSDAYRRTTAPEHGPLSGLRVLEIGHFVVAPFCTAEIDALRQEGVL